MQSSHGGPAPGSQTSPDSIPEPAFSAQPPVPHYMLRMAARLDIPYAAQAARFAAVHAADVSGDGLDDLLAIAVDRAPGEPPAVLVYTARADGGFATPVPLPYRDGVYRASAVTDIEGDGRRELVILSEVSEPGTTPSGSPTDTTLVMATTSLTAAGPGPFVYRPVMAWASYRMGLGYYEGLASTPVLLDADGDRDLDVAVATSFTGMAGRFTGFSLELALFNRASADYLDLRWVDIGSKDGGPVPLPLLQGDFTGDGLDDVAVGMNQLRVYHLQSGTLTAGRVVETETTAPGGAVLADLDGDGRQDFAFPLVSANRGDVGLLSAVATVPAAVPRVFPGLAQTGATGLVARDLDGDQRQDVAQLVTTPSGRFNIALFLQDGSGLLLRAPAEFGVAQLPLAGHLGFGDTNGDACSDAVVAEGGHLWVLEGEGCPLIAPPMGGPLRPEQAP